MIKAFLFDLDGVLTDTSEYHYQAWQRLADEEGLPFSRQDNDGLRGVSRRASLNILLKGKSISEETAESWMERKNNYYVELVENMTPADLLPGAAALLAELRRAGIKIAIASASKNGPLVLERLKLEGAIDCVVDAGLVVHSKPDPEVFLKAAEMLNVAPGECVVVEDAEAGVAAAIAGGMHSLGIGPQERVGKAEVVLPDLAGAHAAELLRKYS
jgi:beta-phosphoglucomutase